MHKEILTKEQIDLLPLVKRFSKDFYLVGGTAIALHLGHRESVDFDLFTYKDFENSKIKRIIRQSKTKIDKTVRDEKGQYTIIINGVHMTFFQYPFSVKTPHQLDKVIKMPGVLDLAAMKAYALGRRAKWKDYVDLYFVMEKHHGIDAIRKKAKDIFKGEFNERLIREQLGYFEDIRYFEKITYMPGFGISDEVVKKGLDKFSSQ